MGVAPCKVDSSCEPQCRGCRWAEGHHANDTVHETSEVSLINEVYHGDAIAGRLVDSMQLSSLSCLVESRAAPGIYVAEVNYHRVTRWVPGTNRGIIVAGGNKQGDRLDQLSEPSSVFVATDGSVYVVEMANHRVTAWIPGASEGKIVAGGRGNGPGLDQLSFPRDVFVDSTGIIYVSEEGNHRVTRWKPSSSSQSEVVAGGDGRGAGKNQLSRPHGIWVDREGAVYVAEADSHRVTKWRPGQNGEIVAGGRGPGGELDQLNYPTGVCVDNTGALLVCEVRNHRVTRWRQGARIGEVVAGGQGKGKHLRQLSSPYSVVFVGEVGLLVAETGNRRISIWAPGADQGIASVEQTERNWPDEADTKLALDNATPEELQLSAPYGIFVVSRSSSNGAVNGNGAANLTPPPLGLGSKGFPDTTN